MSSQHNVDGGFSPFTFAVITDLHLSQRQGMARYERFVEIVNERTDIDFVLNLGDTIWLGPMDELHALMARPNVPVHSFYGNNDADRLAEYEAALGPRDRVIEHNGCLFLVVWNCFPENSPHSHMGEISSDQWQWLENEILAAATRNVRHVFLVSHVPPLCPDGFYEGFYLREETERLFWDFCQRHGVTACFFGHLHQDEIFSRHGTEILVTPSLNWNFAPPPPVAPGADKTWTLVDGGFMRTVRVAADGITHALVPIDLPSDG